MAPLMLFVWPVVALILFAALGREKGLIWTVVAGYLLLPDGFGYELSGLPDYDKRSAVALSAVLGAMLFWGKSSWPVPTFGAGLTKRSRMLMRNAQNAAKIQEIWCELLNLESVAPEDDFFELGGSGKEARKMLRAVSEALRLPLITTAELRSASVLADFTRLVERKSEAEIRAIERASRTGGLGKFFLLLFLAICVGQVMTVQDNGFPLINGDRFRTALGIRDAIAYISDSVIDFTPFFLAWFWLRTPEHHKELLRAIVIFGVIYAFLALVEMRLSPQLNRWVYGYFPHEWQQHVRGGAFRPVVFLRHGLWLAFFLLTASVAAFGLYRMTTSQLRYAYLAAGLWILAVLLISPNLGAALLAILFIPALLFLSRKLLARGMMLVAMIFLLYPAARQAEMVPLDRFLGVIERISVDRAASLEFRFRNEDALLARALEKPVWGWGGWGRSRVIDDRGRDTSTVDGLWILTLGATGWVGYIAFFGVLTLPLLMLPKAVRRKEMSYATAAMAVILAANLVYLLPNSALSPIGWLLAGAIGGFVSWRPDLTAPIAEVIDDDHAKPRYTRFDTAQPVPEVRIPSRDTTPSRTPTPSYRRSRKAKG
ncbi:MAG: hypothetical protein QNJ44_21760 [Rhodobacter sp.]|nr:hypothetical protein [Rhodobacter sp.]